MADAIDSKSIVRKGVRVRIPPPGPDRRRPTADRLAALLVEDAIRLAVDLAPSRRRSGRPSCAAARRAPWRCVHGTCRASGTCVPRAIRSQTSVRRRASWWSARPCRSPLCSGPSWSARERDGRARPRRHAAFQPEDDPIVLSPVAAICVSIATVTPPIACIMCAVDPNMAALVVPTGPGHIRSRCHCLRRQIGRADRDHLEASASPVDADATGSGPRADQVIERCDAVTPGHGDLRVARAGPARHFSTTERADRLGPQLAADHANRQSQCLPVAVDLSMRPGRPSLQPPRTTPAYCTRAAATSATPRTMRRGACRRLAASGDCHAVRAGSSSSGSSATSTMPSGTTEVRSHPASSSRPYPSGPRRRGHARPRLLDRQEVARRHRPRRRRPAWPSRGLPDPRPHGPTQVRPWALSRRVAVGPSPVSSARMGRKPGSERADIFGSSTARVRVDSTRPPP